MRTLRTNKALRGILVVMVMAMSWLGIGPAWGADHQALLQNQREAQWRAAHPPVPLLANGLTDTPSPALWQKINARRALAHAHRVARGLPPNAIQDALGADAAWAAAGGRLTSAPAKGAPLRLASLPHRSRLGSSNLNIRPLTLQQMTHYAGRGPLRNPYFAGSPMPWQRSFHDLNLCTGNLFKSFTDFQIAPGRGAGLVMQRTYNSDDATIGPFGVGWTHAYNIQVQEAADVQAQSGDANADSSPDDVPRTDFFGHKHTYHRDADGLYSPPAYLFDEMNSDYDTQLVDGPTKVEDDTDVGMDGTIKHYINIVTLPDGTEGNDRACDSITDRYGNQTTLAYGLSFVQADGSTRKLLTQVTDPTGRSLVFTWANLGTQAQPAYRITQVEGPLVNGESVSGVTYRVVYGYYTDPNDPNAANDLYNLHTVTLDPDGLNRTTTYTYTGLTGTAPPVQEGQQSQTGTDSGLLASITDPLGHVTSYQYAMSTAPGPNFTGSVWVVQINEPGGVDPSGHPRTLTWGFTAGATGGGTGGQETPPGAQPETFVGCTEFGGNDNQGINGDTRYFFVDSQLRLACYAPYAASGAHVNVWYDGVNNEVDQSPIYSGMDTLQWTYGAHGNMLTSGHGFSPAPYNDSTTTYYNASQYFQKASETDADGHTTTYGVGTDTAGNSGDPDPNIGDRGQVLWVQDPGYADSSSPSYGKEYTYTYNGYGQKISETNLNGVVTTYTYGDAFGNLTQVVQDPGGAGHLNRTTTMTYDAAGRVLTSTDPLGQVSTFTYNTLGQPVSVATPARGNAPAETITYTYDANGRTSTVTDNRGTTAMTYEAGCDRVASVTDPVTGTTSYTYGMEGERLTMTLPGGGMWTYGGYMPAQDTTDPAKAQAVPTQVTDDQGRQTLYSYSDTGQLLAVTSDQVFNSSGGLVSHLDTNLGYGASSGPAMYQTWLTHTQTTWTGPYTVNGYPQTLSKIVNENAYTYDQAGQRLTNAVSSQVLDSSGVPETDGNNNPILTTRTETYTYDDLSRLASVNYGDGQTQSYTFDPMGNRLSRQDSVAGTTNSTYNAANMLTATTGTGASSYTSDADGDTLTGGGRTLTWDSQNRLVSCLLGSQTSTFTYGADGLRRSMAVSGGTTTDYAYDGQSMVREMQVNPTTGSLVATATYLTGVRGPEYRRDDTQTDSICWYVYDGLGSVVGEVDPLGNLTCSNEYDVYGNVRGRVGTASTAHGFVGSLGHLSDASTGLVYMRARYYDPSTGRFASQDPSANGNNWFEYSNNNPTNSADFTGRFALPPGFFEYIIDFALDHANEIADIAQELYDTAKALIKGSKAEIKTAGAEEGAADEQKVIGDEELATPLDEAAGESAIGAAENVAEAVELQEVADWISEGNPNCDGF